MDQQSSGASTWECKVKQKVGKEGGTNIIFMESAIGKVRDQENGYI